MATQKTVLITGANGGLGSALVDIYLANQWQVIAVDQHTMHPQPNVTPIKCDFTNEQNVHQLLKTIGTYTIDSLILNAAYYSLKPMHDINANNLSQSWMVNVVAHFQLLQHLAKANASLANCFVIGTDQLFTPFAYNMSYCMTKAALMQMVKSFAVEYDEPKILGLCPITLENTTMTLQAAEGLAQLNNQTTAEVLAMFAEQSPEGKHLDPVDIAAWIYSLEAANTYQSGDIIYVDQQVVNI